MNAMTATNGHRALLSQWQTLTVRDFFSQLSWTGQPTLNFQIEDAAPEPLPIADMRLSVRDFFSRFPWEGSPDIAAPMAPLALQADDLMPPEDDLTLDAFSDLF